MRLLSSHDLDSSRVPLFPLPSFDTHGSQGEKRDGSVTWREPKKEERSQFAIDSFDRHERLERRAFSELDTTSNGRVRSSDGDFRVDPEVSREREVERVWACCSVRRFSGVVLAVRNRG